MIKVFSQRSLGIVTKNKGQIIVEYILLMVISVTLALIVVSKFASRKRGEEGFLIRALCAIHQVIGEDIPDNPSTPSNGKSQCK